MRASLCPLNCLILFSAHLSLAQEFRPAIPRVWEDREVAGFEVPLVQRERSPRYMTSAEYYALKVRPIYRSYPVYAPGREPAGYRESLLQKEPEIIFDLAKLRTKDDWIKAGKAVFESQTVFRPAPAVPTVDPSLPISPEGILPPFRPGGHYIIRKRGTLEIGSNACSDCHTRVMPDGSYFEGGQGITGPATDAIMDTLRKGTPDAVARLVEREWTLFGAPWITNKEQFVKSLPREELTRAFSARIPGVYPRQGTSSTHPVHIPSLVGIEDRRYLDATGIVRHRSIGDLARYAVVNMGLDTLAFYGDFQPSAEPTPFSSEPGTRYSDEQLYAMALYLYSLKPPANPNAVNEQTRRGEQVFQQQGCAGCHTPPLYTNNKLTPATGFRVPDDLRKTNDILDVPVGTDPTLAMQTRRGTGFYKVPSIRGVWFRNGFGHDGQAQTLEEWFDPERLKEGYVPKGYHIGPGPIKGHEFGLKLQPDDRQALIAFLKTL